MNHHFYGKLLTKLSQLLKEQDVHPLLVEKRLKRLNHGGSSDDVAGLRMDPEYVDSYWRLVAEYDIAALTLDDKEFQQWADEEFREGLRGFGDHPLDDGSLPK